VGDQEKSLEITRRDGGKVYQRDTDGKHRFVLRKFRGEVLDVEDMHFHFDSAVLMPDFGDQGVSPDALDDANRVTGLAALRSVHVHAEAHPAQKVLITGHTDRSGSDEYNLKLSQQRADGVLHLLLGHRDEWVAVSHKKHVVEDVQQILKWADQRLGWGCDPGGVDNKAGPKTTEATKRFQARYNKELGKSIAEDGAVGAQTWGAFYDVYLIVLADLLHTDEAGLAARQQDLAGRFVDGGRKALGCGENHPLTANKVANRRSQIDRRVEVMFFDPGEKPLLDCHPGPAKCRADECEIYDPLYFTLDPIPIKPIVDVVFIGARLHGNFDRKEGGQNVDANNLAKRGPRILRPGAIILPNLDIDEDPAAARTRFKHTQTDALVDDKVNDGDDENDLTAFEIVEPVPLVGNAVKVILKLDAKDAERVRIWEIPPGKTPKDGVVRVGPSVGVQHVVEDVSAGQPRPPAGWKQSYIVEARTLAGDPKFPAPAAKAPPPPGKLREPIPDKKGGSQKNPSVNEADTGKSIYDSEPQRSPGDIWVELVQESPSGPDADLRDIGLFTIAPWIMTWNTLKCQRVYVAYINFGGRMNDPSRDARLENHCMVWDLQTACSQAGLGTAPDADTTKPIATNQPKDITQPNDVPFYVIPGASVRNDPWVQDEFEIGYCFAPHHWLHVALHNKRQRGLAKFVENEMAHARLAVFNGIAEFVPESIDYGGNLEVSPPVKKATPKIDRGPAGSVSGPSCKAHDRPAPFGKIIVGDCTPRPVHPEFHKFLQAQRVQPVLPLDTSWLAVGHVDEFLSFVRTVTAREWALLFASVRTMTRVLREVVRVDPVATLHAGKYEMPDGTSWVYDEAFAQEWLTGLGKVKIYSETVETEKLDPIRDRLKIGLDIDDPDILPIPTYFLPGNNKKPLGDRANRTVARNVGMVNMLVVDNHLMVPRPFGPRLEVSKATDALEAVLKEVMKASGSIPPVKLPSPDEHFFWARPGESLAHIAMYFARPAGASDALVKAQRTKLIDKLKHNSTDLSGLDADYKKAIEDLMQAILNDPDNSGAPTPIDTVAPAPGRRFKNWMRIKIPGNTVDVLEGYMKSVLEPFGPSVHFIDDFECYHALMGEVHCGTNAKREPPEEQGAFFTERWWDQGVYDPDYDTSYDPAS